MDDPDDRPPGKDAPERKQSRIEQARRLVADHIDDLRALVEKLRRKMN
jgi:signal transduction histidine kinase